MKTAIYIEDGLMEFVLTPETEIDKKVVEALKSADGLETYMGEFYGCQGGWTRWSPYESQHTSLIFKVTKRVEKPAADQIEG